MTLRSLSLSAFAVSALLLAISAHAHDPSEHEPSQVPTPTAKPATCAQLADTQRYSNDLTDPDVKALKARCDAAKKVPAKKPASQSR